MIKIEKMEQKDTRIILSMMQVFYNSPAVLHQVSQEVLKCDIEACVNDNPYIEGFVFKEKENVAGYAMIAKSFSTEFGGVCIWIEDIYIQPEYRDKGIGTQFFQYLEENFREKAVLFKLEVERSNTQAITVYKKCGYQELPYMEMIKER